VLISLAISKRPAEVISRFQSHTTGRNFEIQIQIFTLTATGTIITRYVVSNTENIRDAFVMAEGAIDVFEQRWPRSGRRHATLLNYELKNPLASMRALSMLRAHEG
jgi:hypothetical protein